MGIAILKVLVAAIIISFVSWLADKKVGLAGFITAIPLTTMLALLFTQAQWGDAKQSVKFAQSVFYAVPVTLTFFLPFLFAEKFNLGFWACYGIGVFFLSIGYIVHTQVFKFV